MFYIRSFLLLLIFSTYHFAAVKSISVHLPDFGLYLGDSLEYDSDRIKTVLELKNWLIKVSPRKIKEIFLEVTARCGKFKDPNSFILVRNYAFGIKIFYRNQLDELIDSIVNIECANEEKPVSKKDLNKEILNEIESIRSPAEKAAELKREQDRLKKLREGRENRKQKERMDRAKKFTCTETNDERTHFECKESYGIKFWCKKEKQKGTKDEFKCEQK